MKTGFKKEVIGITEKVNPKRIYIDKLKQNKMLQKIKHIILKNGS
jgi:hypothetical protein